MILINIFITLNLKLVIKLKINYYNYEINHLIFIVENFIKFYKIKTIKYHDSCTKDK